MTNSQRLAAVRERLTQWLCEQRDPSEDEAEFSILRESILIRNEFYCGRRFHTANHDAVWFIEEDELKIYHSNGQLACVFKGDEIDVGADDGGSADVIPMPTPPSEAPIRKAA